MPTPKTWKIALLPGDGVGPEVIAATKAVLQVIGDFYDHDFQFSEHLIEQRVKLFIALQTIDARAVALARRVPIHAIKSRIEVFLVDGFPYLLEHLNPVFFRKRFGGNTSQNFLFFL